MGRLLSKAELLRRMYVISNPKAHGLSQEALEQDVIDFCAGCPDPLEAYRIIAECPEDLSDEEVVDRALNEPIRHMSEVSYAIVPVNHPARAGV
jgi:hypothetical protein